MAKLIEITGKAISGEWGNDDETGNGIPVLRTTNFTNTGIVDFSNVVTRDIQKKNISDKYLLNGDIIIEKSGGSDTQPVGRVIFFEAAENKYLFNNFTGLLRVKDKSVCYPKYLFYYLFSNYQKGGTIPFQNKTTGLHNLKTDDYVRKCEVPLPPLETQRQIAANLDKVTHTIDLCNAILEKLDLLVKSRFVEMFGDIIRNTKQWDIHIFSDITTSRLGKMLDAKKQTGENAFPYLANFNVQWFRFELDNLNTMDFDAKDQAEFSLEEDDLLVCEGGEIGRCAIWHNEVSPCYFQKALHRVRCNKEIIMPTYLAWWFRFNCDNNGFSEIEGAKATIAHLPGAKLKKLPVVVPPLALQEQFAAFVEQTDKSKLAVKQVLEKAETLKKALMQEYFG